MFVGNLLVTFLLVKLRQGGKFFFNDALLFLNPVYAN